MSEIVKLWGPWAVFAVALAIWLWSKYGKAGELIMAVGKIIPSQFDPIVAQVVTLAINAVDQKVKGYEKLTNAQRLELAKKYMGELLAFYQRDLSDVAKEALIEAELWLRHQAQAGGGGGIVEDQPGPR